MNTDNHTGSCTRRNFIRDACCAALGFTALPLALPRENLLAKSPYRPRKADYWERLSGGRVRCLLCPNRCVLSPGETGACHGRMNRGGTLYSLTYGRPSVLALDTVEKSPLYHFNFREQALSIATAGCNLSCRYCQNWEVSQVKPDRVDKVFHLEPYEVIDRAKRHGVRAVNFFYTEPVVYYEYMRDIARLAKKQNMKTFCITAGYINPEPLEEMIPLVDAFVVGLKGFTDSFYRDIIGGRLEPVKDSLVTLARHRDKTWFEIVTLLVPGYNDSSRTIKAMTEWIAGNIGREIPLHFTRFEPYYKMKDTPPTPPETLRRADGIAREAGLRYVYLGNLPGGEGSATVCPRCGETVIERINFTVIKNRLQKGKCPCGETIPGRWDTR